ncbi:MAG: AAA family ATPase [Rugosibacter sp.]|jgi:wobble nucleotide-excising tRNase
MISKARRLKNIGKFYYFSSSANDLDWHKNTFVFAPNAYGKTTFVNVLRSLRDNDPKLIRSRKTLGAKANPEAVLAIGGMNHVFDGSRWDKPHPDIQIFDAPFIQANILTHEIGHEHKKNIHKIIIGEQGKKLAEDLSALKTKEKAKSQEAANLVAQFNRGGFTLSIDAILAIPAAEETAVGERIQKLEQDIKSKESEETVQKLGYPRLMAAPSFDLSGAKALASKKLVAVHEAAEREVLAHIDHNFKDKSQARQFIRQGLDAMQADCPFCGQDLKNAADLLKAYREFFDETFRAYQQGVVQQLTSIEKWNLDNDLTALISLHNANLASVRQWEKYLGEIELSDFAATVDRYSAGLAASKGRVLSELEKKQKDPNADADLSSIDALTSDLAGLKAAVDGYNSEVTAFTEKAKLYVASLPKSDVASIRAGLTKQQEIKKRFTPEWKRWATDYAATKKDAAALQTQKNAKQKELEDAGKTIFDTYQKRINELLKTLGTDFAITGLTGKTDERANESYSDFGFLILEQIVPLTTRQEEAPCFKNTLSEGDKSTLAFAFFIAALEKTPALDKQIVVFDDPLSSLDETRREATARLLLALSPTVNQLNVFTHKRDFLHMLCDKMPENKTLQVRSDKEHGSQFAVLDVEEDRKSAHARLIESMEHYLSEDFGPTAETMQGNLRKLFETVLKTKYYRVLASDIKAKHGLATLLATLSTAGLVDVVIKPRLFNLCSVANSSHHGEIVDVTAQHLTRDELLPLIREALDLVHKV